ncbi:DUF3383 family protein [Commensalibacter papalotli (ex Botero et al. 2024)]|uniref:Phage tail protein n=1 Tax=Commensalibacter papalotli (ex Botero et al. 2024) TaxID=2972766 RepID=A0ABM9HKT4_9PROT|nr:DUF3383 family protein [Commensalibacter papalotli (ex Botero et al. 2024)]CAI3932037.1 unnamed protein product [Commensalibacter papalotli (ex Botero et al. 2024)]
MSIPLNNIVKINPGVLDVGNNGNNLFGLMLTQNVGVPAGQTTAFTSANQVGIIFGMKSEEYKLASVYFSGFTNSDRVAEQLYIAPYFKETTPSSLIGGSLQKVTLEQLRNFSNDIHVSFNYEQLSNVKKIDLSGATSFSHAASILSSAIFGDQNPPVSIINTDIDTDTDTNTNTNTRSDPEGSVTYSEATQSMIINSKTTGDHISVSGTLADQLKLTNGLLCAGSNAPNLSSLLDELRQTNLSFCSVFLTWEGSEAEKLELAQWANSTKDDVCVILNDTYDKDKKLILSDIVKNGNYEGVVCVYNNPNLCAFIAGYPAAWDLTKTDGRFTAAFRRSSLLTANVFDEQEALTLKDKGYNFYGVWASSTSNFTFMYEGRISGQYIWLDSWFCQVWMRRQFQYYFVMTLLSRGQIPYNTDGKGILTTAIKPAIDQYMNFGAVRPGVALADEQIQQLKQAGLNQSQINSITTVGYYLKVDMERVSPQTRVKRNSPPINFWYTDGQSVQQINMNSIEIQ